MTTEEVEENLKNINRMLKSELRSLAIEIGIKTQNRFTISELRPYVKVMLEQMISHV